MQNTGLNLQLSSSRQSDQWNGAGGARLGVTGTALPTDGWPRLESCVPVQPEEVEAGGCRTVPTTDFRSCIGLWRVRHVGLEALVCRPNPWSTTKTGASNRMHLATSEHAYWQWLGPRDCRFLHGGCRQARTTSVPWLSPVKRILPVRRDELI